MKRFAKVGFAMAMPIAALMIMLGQAGCTSKDTSNVNTPSKSQVISAPAVELRSSMRKLWEEHVMWTRNVILCIVDDAPGTEQAVKRLLKNQVDIGNAFKPYYGEASGNKLTELLVAHISLSTEVIKAAKANDGAVLEESNKKWMANADEIALFLNKANPNWALEDMKMMMSNHLKLTNEELVKRINEDYDGDVLAYDQVQNEILKMSDMLSNGITKQFPDKF